MAGRKFKILFLIHQFAQGGAEQQMFELVKGIDKEKFSVAVGCLVRGGKKWEDFRAIQNIKVVCFDRKHRFNIFVLAKIVSFLRENPVDIIHAYLAPAAVFGILAGLMSQTPILIIGERGQTSFATLGSRIYAILATLIARFTDLIITNSVAGRQRTIDSGVSPDRIVVIPNGVSSERLRMKTTQTRCTLKINDHCPILGNVASFVHIKDHLTLLKAVLLVRTKYPHVRCLLVGNGPLGDRLQEYVKRMQLSENVVFLGYQDSVTDFIRLFDVAILSSKYEGCSNFILEAMACGKPVVATDAGGTSELVIDGATGFLVDKEDPQALATAVLKLLKDERLRAKLGIAGRQRVEQEFRVERMIKRTEEIYERLCLCKLGERSGHRFRAVNFIAPQEEDNEKIRIVRK